MGTIRDGYARLIADAENLAAEFPESVDARETVERLKETRGRLSPCISRRQYDERISREIRTKEDEKMKELSIGEVGKIDGVKVRCVEGYGCNVCLLNEDDDTPCKTVACVPWERIDGKTVHFEEVQS